VKSGQVVEQGTHDELVEREDGAYSSLIRRQLEAQRKLDVGEVADNDTSRSGIAVDDSIANDTAPDGSIETTGGGTDLSGD